MPELRATTGPNWTRPGGRFHRRAPKEIAREVLGADRRSSTGSTSSTDPPPHRPDWPPFERRSAASAWVGRSTRRCWLPVRTVSVLGDPNQSAVLARRQVSCDGRSLRLNFGSGLSGAAGIVLVGSVNEGLRGLTPCSSGREQDLADVARGLHLPVRGSGILEGVPRVQRSGAPDRASMRGHTCSRTAATMAAFSVAGPGTQPGGDHGASFGEQGAEVELALAAAHQADGHQPAVRGEQVDVAAEVLGADVVEDDVGAVTVRQLSHTARRSPPRGS